MDIIVPKYKADLENRFGYFITELWKDRGLDQYHPIGRIEWDTCDWVQYGPTHQGELLFRGWGKTYVFSAGGTCWDLLRDPQWKEFIVSKSINQARKTLRLIRGWINSVPFLQHLKPRVRDLREQLDARDTALFFDVGPAKDVRDPSVSVMGIEGQLPGTRAHRIWADDVETKENTLTLEAREALKVKVSEFTAIASYGERRVNIIGTFHHEESLYIHQAKEKGIAFRTWPALYPEPKDKILGLAPILQKDLDEEKAKPGDIVDPDYTPPDRIAELQAEGRTWFAMQCMLIANLGDALRYPLRLSDLIVFNVQRDQAPTSIIWGTNNGQGMPTRCEDIKSLGLGTDCLYAPIMFDNKWGPYTGTKMWVDPSGAGADETGYGVVAHGSGMLWAKAVGGLAGEPGKSGYSPATMAELAKVARRYRATEIYVEENFGQGMFRQLFEPVLARHFLEPGQDPEYPSGWKCSIEGVRVHGQKELRIIDTLEPVMNQHRLVVNRAVAANEVLQYQLTRLTRQRKSLQHDDQIEALAMCVKMWEDVLHQDPAIAGERDRQRQLDEQLEEHRRLLEHATRMTQGGTPEPAVSWIQH